jgi:hypothetical protein
MRSLETISQVFAGLGFLILVVGVMGARGAPQEAAAAGMALGVAAIPYFFTSIAQRRRILKLLEANSTPKD